MGKDLCCRYALFTVYTYLALLNHVVGRKMYVADRPSYHQPMSSTSARWGRIYQLCHFAMKRLSNFEKSAADTPCYLENEKISNFESTINEKSAL